MAHKRQDKERKWAYSNPLPVTDELELVADTEDQGLKTATAEEREILHDMFATYWGGRPMITIPPMR